MSVKYPEVKVQLVGQDGNAFSILGRCRGACREFLPNETWEIVWNEFKAEATNGNYDHLLCTVMEFFSVDEEDEFDEDDDMEKDEELCDCGHNIWDCVCDIDEEEDEYDD